MAKRLIDYDPVTLTQTWHDYDVASDKTEIVEIKDVEHVLESTNAARNWDVGGAKGLNAYSKKGIKEGFWHVASIPNSVQLKWKTELGIDIFNKDHWPAVRKLLNDSEWAYLRTGTGQV